MSLLESRTVHRRLAAILAADVVGYARLMREDEARTHAQIRAYRKDLFEPKIAEHGGHIVKLTGDGMLVEFPSVVEAVQCARDLQRAMADRNTGVPKSRQIEVRIGINLGDVIVEEEDIYGDGVNLAARLESLAEPGGICVSRTVFNHVKNKVELGFEDLGEQLVKNIDEPIQVYRVLIDPAAGRASTAPKRIGRTRWKWTAAAAMTVFLLGAGAFAVWLQPWVPKVGPEPVEGVTYPLPDKPSIAVLPFVNLSDDSEQENFTDAITLDIITDLSKFSSLFVIAANSTFRYKGQAVKPQDVGKDLQVRYILEGSVQWIEDQLRINAQLIDATNGHHIWADRYDRQTTDLFAVQNEIGRKIVGIIGPISDAHGKLLKVELDRLDRTATNSLEAYDHFLKGVVHFEKFSKEENRLARKEFENAILLDSNYSKAIAKIAWTYLYEYWNDWGDEPEKSLIVAKEVAHDAIEADPSEADAHQALGAVSLFQRKHDLAISSFRKAVELNPNGANLMMELGWALTYSGLPDEGLQIMGEAISRNPYYPGWYLWDLAWGHFVAQRYEEAIEPLEKRTPKSNFTHLMLAVNYAKVGRLKEAAYSMQTFRKVEPGYSINTAARTEPFKNPEDLTHYLEALREAGLPEHAPDD